MSEQDQEPGAPEELEDELDAEQETAAEEPSDADAGPGAAPNVEPGDREAELEAKIAELKDQLLRAIAEADNLRKRTEREMSQTRKFGIANFAKDLLSAADNLRRALDSGPEDLDGADESVRNLIIGVEMTERELLGAFEKHGIRKIEPVGEKFDYNFHQAMFEVEDSGEEAGTVVQVLQPGYAIEDRVLRAAMVGVAKGPAESSEHIDTTA